MKYFEIKDKGAEMLKGFKEFALKGNVIDLAVGVIIGSSFGAIVKSLVDDIIMPPIGFLLGNVDFSNLFIVIKEGSIPGPYMTAIEANKSGAIVIRYGIFANSIVSFSIISFSIFMLINQLSRFKKSEAITNPIVGPTEVQLLEEIRDLLKNK